jgi:hypothetical protein
MSGSDSTVLINQAGLATHAAGTSVTLVRTFCEKVDREDFAKKHRL